MSIFGRLGYDSANTSNVVTTLSANVISTLNSMPAILNTWQTADVANTDVGGYFQNPVANVTQSIWNVANSIITVTGIYDVSNLANVIISANSLIASCNSFYLHTNRISGVAPVTDEPTQPHYSSAIGVSKVVMYITFKSDGIQNNAPMMGNFTSLTIANNLSESYNTIINYANTLTNSINIIANTTNLTPSQTSTIANNLNNITNLMNSRRNGDVNFYYNSQAIVDDYNSLKQFSNPGQSESYLFNNYIGTDKLKTRINS
jgi:hypothetical protein